MTGASLATVVYFDLGDTLIYYGPDNTPQPFADAAATLQTLHERGYRLGLLSNQAPGTTVDDVKARLDEYGFSDYIEYELISISTEIPGNIGKPEQPIFNLALEKAGHPTGTGPWLSRRVRLGLSSGVQRCEAWMPDTEISWLRAAFTGLVNIGIAIPGNCQREEFAMGSKMAMWRCSGVGRDSALRGREEGAAHH